MAVDSALDVVNERLHRLEAEVDTIKSDVNEQKVTIARITEQVSSHEKRGEERHHQVLAAITDMKNDYRMLFHNQAEDAKAYVLAERERSANTTKVILAILGTMGTIIGAMYGFNPFGASDTAPQSQEGSAKP